VFIVAYLIVGKNPGRNNSENEQGYNYKKGPPVKIHIILFHEPVKIDSIEEFF
jgi:hypothetical protein